MTRLRVRWVPPNMRSASSRVIQRLRLVRPRERPTDLDLGRSALSRRARRRWCSLSGPPERSTTSCTASRESVEVASRAKPETSRSLTPLKNFLRAEIRPTEHLLVLKEARRSGGGLLSRLWTQGFPAFRTLGALAKYGTHGPTTAKHRGNDR